MLDVEQFPRAPILEALLDIQVELPDSVNLGQLQNFQEAIKDRYPSKKLRTSGAISVTIQEKTGYPVIQQSGGPVGYIFASPDQKQAVQARLNGFSFSRFKPYEAWEKLRDEAQELWRHYIRIASPRSVTRLALRYINRIEIPLPIGDFKEYVRTAPDIAPNLPQGLSTFFMRLVIPKPDVQATAIVSERMEEIKENRVPLIFDIDVFRFSKHEADSDEVWEIFENLRNLKNEIFFESVTDKAKELFR